MVQFSHLYVTTGKTISLTIWTFVGKMMSLIFNTLPRFVIEFFPRSKHLYISWLQSLSAVILKPKKIKFVIFPHFFPSINHEVMRPYARILDFLTLSLKPTFSLSSFTLIKRLFSSSSISTIRVVSSAYLRLLIFQDFWQSWFQLVLHLAQHFARCTLHIRLQHRRPMFDPWVGKIPWRRKWQPTPLILPGASHGQRSLAGYSPWGCKELDTTEWLTHFLGHRAWTACGRDSVSEWQSPMTMILQSLSLHH